MSAPSRIVRIDHRSWDDAPGQAGASTPVAELEEGKVLYFPELRFELSQAETGLLDPALVDPKRKNISLNATTGKLTGVAVEDERQAAIGALVRRYY
ncbi:Kdo hydroxylase family protein, partial [Pigmentiphaga sp. GD03639]